LRERRVTIPLQNPSLFTDSHEHQEYIRKDPFTLRKITVRFALADRALTRYTIETPREIRLPTLLMLAGRDRIVDNDRVRQFVDEFSADKKTIIEYPDAAHTLEFEPDPAGYFDDLARWAKELVS